jgi:hypothetical protein
MVWTSFGTGGLDIQASDNVFRILPGLDVNINVPPGSKVFVSTDGGATTYAPAGGFSAVEIGLFVDGTLMVNGGYRRIVALNQLNIGHVNANWSFGLGLSLPEGTHRFSIGADVNGGVDARLSGDATSIHQGQMTIMIVKE